MKKFVSMILVLVTALALMVPVFASASAEALPTTMWVNCADGKRLNVREAPNTHSKVLYRVDSGKQVEIMIQDSESSAWVYVRENGKPCGYVMKKFLQANKPGKYEVTERADNFRTVSSYTVAARALNNKTTNSVCLRVKPNKTAKSLRRLAAGDTLTVIAVGKTWSKVVDKATGRTGYVANDYIARV